MVKPIVTHFGSANALAIGLILMTISLCALPFLQSLWILIPVYYFLNHGISICVPTPLRKTKDPDISYIIEVTGAICKYLHPGQLIVLESTTYPGTTDEVILPRMQETGFGLGEDFFLAFSLAGASGSIDKSQRCTK